MKYPKKSPLLLPFTSISHYLAPFEGSRCQLAVKGNEVAEAPWWTCDWAVFWPTRWVPHFIQTSLCLWGIQTDGSMREKSSPLYTGGSQWNWHCIWPEAGPSQACCFTQDWAVFLPCVFKGHPTGRNSYGGSFLLFLCRTCGNDCKIKKTMLNVQTSWYLQADTDTSGISTSAKPLWNATIFMNKLFCAWVLSLEEEDGWLRGPPGFALSRYSCSAERQLISTNSCGCFRRLPPQLFRWRVISRGTRVPSAQNVWRSKPALWLSNHVSAVSWEYREAHYQYILMESSGDVAAEKMGFSMQKMRLDVGYMWQLGWDYNPFQSKSNR